MVEMGMGKDHRVDGPWIDLAKEGAVLRVRLRSLALEGATIDENAYPVKFHEMLGTSDFAGRAERSQRYAHDTSILRTRPQAKDERLWRE